jgi:2'-hydroxyisoflavone reductase
MRLLVLGGTRFLGRAIVDEAISRGYDVTTFSRGSSGHPRPGAEALYGDRTRPDDLRQLAGREWDAVIDTSVLAPAHVGASARLLADRVGHYCYVSSISVYAGRPREPVTEDSPILDCPPEATGTMETLGYGELKAGSERAAAAAMPGRCLIVRPGLIVGPHEDVGRLPWWLTRLARGGTVLAPGDPGRPVRLTDSRDLAAWLVDNTRRGIPAIVNVPGPEGTTMGELLTACARLTVPDRTAAPGRAAGQAGSAAPGRGQSTAADPAPGVELRWVPDQVLLDAGVQPWMELPMWAPDIPELAGTWQVSGDRALRTGIRYRPVADTAHDTWLWLKQEEAADRPAAGFAWRPGIGLDPERERQILAAVQ